MSSSLRPPRTSWVVKYVDVDINITESQKHCTKIKTRFLSAWAMSILALSTIFTISSVLVLQNVEMNMTSKMVTMAMAYLLCTGGLSVSIESLQFRGSTSTEIACDQWSRLGKNQGECPDSNLGPPQSWKGWHLSSLAKNPPNPKTSTKSKCSPLFLSACCSLHQLKN